MMAAPRKRGGSRVSQSCEEIVDLIEAASAQHFGRAAPWVDRHIGRARDIALVALVGNLARIIQCAATRAAGGGHFQSRCSRRIGGGVAEAVGLPPAWNSPRMRRRRRQFSTNGRPPRRGRLMATARDPGAQGRYQCRSRSLRAVPGQHIRHGREPRHCL